MSKLRVGILQQASGVPAGFNAAGFVASALVDQDWTSLGGTPAGWTVTGGTPDYNVDGVTQTDGTTLVLENDISGFSSQVPDGWLLMIVKYDDLYSVGVDGKVTDTGGTNYIYGEYVGVPATEADGLFRRQESAGPLTCDATTFLELFDSPPGSTMYFGPTATISSPGNQVMEATQWFDNDIDGDSFGLISGDICTSFSATDADKIIIRIHDVSVPGGTTLVRSLYWNTRPPTPTDFGSVATYLGWTP